MNKILLDTNILILTAAGKTPPKVINYINDRTNIFLFSSASIWEIAIKSSLNRPSFPIYPNEFYNELLSVGLEELSVNSRHALIVKTLPTLHKDPFDRILIAQAIYEGVTLLTTDKIMAKYNEQVVYVG